MGTANYSINFSAGTSTTSGTPVQMGDVLCLDAAGATYVLATTANKGTRKSTGIALAAASGTNGPVPMQSDGQISAGTLGLTSLAGCA